MLRVSMLSLLMLVAAVPAAAQAPRTYNLSDPLVEDIAKYLGKQPWTEANPLMQRLIAEINAQTKGAPPAPAKPSPRPDTPAASEPQK